MDSKWAQQMEGWIGTAPSFFQEGNAAIDTSKNILNLKTIYEEGKEPENVTCDCGFMDVTAPLLTSVDMVQYGYFEVRAKFANAELFSAFWVQCCCTSPPLPLLTLVAFHAAHQKMGLVCCFSA